MTLGTQKGKLVPCARSQHHGFHPDGEVCGYCPPSLLPPASAPAEWFVDIEHGIMWDANLYPSLREDWQHFMPLAHVGSYSSTSKAMCGCHRGGPHTIYRHVTSGIGITLCRSPQAIGNPNYQETK